MLTAMMMMMMMKTAEKSPDDGTTYRKGLRLDESEHHFQLKFIAFNIALEIILR
jgi:hypothetical protein